MQLNLTDPTLTLEQNVEQVTAEFAPRVSWRRRKVCSATVTAVLETFCENSQVQVLPRQRLATDRDRVLRGARVTSAAKRPQGPRD